MIQDNQLNAEAQAYGLSREDFEFVFDRVQGPDGKYYKEMK